MIIRKLICPDSPRGFLEGSGAGSGGGGADNSNSGVDFGGTAFGIDGVSATGSTATDAAIGYTSSEGSNEAGPNFGGLSGATSSQVANAVAASQAAQKGGGDLGAQQAAAGLSLAGQAPSVAASNAISAAQATQAQIAEAQATPDELSMGVNPFSSSSSALNVDAFAPDLSTQIDDAIMAENIAGEYGVATPDFSSLQSAPGTGLGSFTAPTGRGALAGTQLNTAIGSLGAQLAGQAQAQAQNNINSQMSGTPNLATQTMMEQVGPTQTTNLSAMIDEAVAAENEVGAYGVTPTGQSLANQGMAYSSPVQDAQGNYTINGVPVDTAFAQQVIADQAKVVEAMPSPSAGLMAYIGKVPGVLSGIAALTGYDPTKSAAEAYGTMLAMPGAEVDEAGNITAPAGRGTLNYSQTLGGITYSGMPDPSYSGPFASLVNPPADMGGQAGDRPLMETVVEEAVSDPCPAGYTLVDGVCQPTSPIDTPLDTRFVLPATPMSFQPITQATPAQQINPFVLSPTGAALGRQI